MKLKHYTLLFFAITLASCMHGDPPGRATYYTYENQTASTISVKVGREGGERLIADFEIAPGKEFQMLFFGGLGGSIASPFNTGCKLCIITISNGEKSYTQFNKEFDTPNTLFDLDIYEEVRVTNTEAYYKYVFTDKDFENAKPIEPEK